MRLRPDDSIVVRLALIATLVIAAVSVVVAIHKLDASRQPASAPVASGTAAADAELIRCRDLGTAAAKDEGCLAAWSEEQRRFFGTSDIPQSVPTGLPPAEGTEEDAVDDQAEGKEAP